MKRSRTDPLARGFLVVLFLTLCCGSPHPNDPLPKVSLTGTGNESIDRRQPIFEDASARTGLRFEHRNGMSGEFYYNEIMGAGAAFFDYDGDGDLDVYLVQGEPQGIGEGDVASTALFRAGDRLWRNELMETGVVRFADVTEQAGLEGLSGYGMGVAVGDFDNDGWNDLYVTNYGPNRLLHNRGDGTFVDVTEVAGAIDEQWSTSAAFVDFDADGWLDLYVVNYVDFRIADGRYCRSSTGRQDYCGPHNYQGLADRLLRNRGDGSFEDVSAATGISAHRRAGLGVVTADLDADGRLDLYVGNDLARNFLWLGRPAGFEEAALLRGSAVNADGHAEASMGLEAADLDNDGDEDLFLTHLRAETNTAYENDGSGFFEDRSSAYGLGPPSVDLTGFGTAAVDLDHDGWLDLVVVNGSVTLLESRAEVGDPFPLGQVNQVFLGRQDGGFDLLPAAAAGDTFGDYRVSRGLATGDIDNDGDIDLLVTNNNGPAQLLLNQVGAVGSWIGLRLVGDAQFGGRDLLGALASVTRPNGESGSPILWRRVRTDGSYGSARDPRLHFGLGDWQGTVGVEVYWPDGQRERWGELQSGRYHLLEQGRSEAN